MHLKVQKYNDILSKMKELEGCGDVEYAHGEADDLLIEWLRYLKYKDLIEAWDKVPKWYA